MDIIKYNMLNLYYNNLNIYAKKYKININIPIIDTLNSIEIQEKTITECDTEIVSEEYVYKKPWNKLNIIHKVIKMKEFANNLNINDIELKNHLKNQLIEMIKNKQLTKKSEVEYDHINCKILSIPSLKFK